MSEAENTISIWSWIAEARCAVQLVTLILFVAYTISRVMIFQRGMSTRNDHTAFLAFEKQFWSGIDLNQLFRQGNGRADTDGVENIFRAGFKEFTRLRQQTGADPDAVMEGSQRAMRVALAREEEKLE